MALASRRLLPSTLGLVFGLASVALPQDGAPRPPLLRGPVESRDEWLLAQPVLTLPALSPDPLGAGRTEIRLDGDWGSDFGVDIGPGGRAQDLRFLVDGEHRSGAVTVRRGFGARWTLGARAVVLWRGHGLMDGIIDGFHSTFDLPDSGRSLYPNGQLRVEGRAPDRLAVAWGGRAGTGLGNVELEAQRSFGRPGEGWRTAIAMRVSAPSATGPFAGAGPAAGAQLLAARTFGSRTEIYGGLGMSVRSEREFEGLRYPRTRLQAFTALDVRLARGWSVVAQLDGAGRLVENVDSYPGALAYLRFASRWRIAGWTLETGVTEGVVSQEAATDFGVLAGIRRVF
jgi:hypothetical protein